MRRSIFGILGIGIIAMAVILVVTLPVSGAGRAGPQDGPGNQFGMNQQNSLNQAGQQFCQGNETCIRENCPNNGVAPRDGTGMQYGRSGKGSGQGRQAGTDGRAMCHRYRS